MKNTEQAKGPIENVSSTIAVLHRSIKVIFVRDKVTYTICFKLSEFIVTDTESFCLVPVIIGSEKMNAKLSYVGDIVTLTLSGKKNKTEESFTKDFSKRTTSQLHKSFYIRKLHEIVA